MNFIRIKRSISAILISLIIFSSSGQSSILIDKNVQATSWTDSLLVAYKSFLRQRDVSSANKLFRAAELMPIKNWEIYIISATIYSEFDEIDKAFLAIDKAMEFGLTNVDLLKSLPEFSNIKADSRWSLIIKKAEELSLEYFASIEQPEVLDLLKSMWAEDQRQLSMYNNETEKLGENLTLEQKNVLFAKVEQVWEKNKTTLDSIISIYDWPGYSLVGKEGEKISWAIVQHYPNVFYKKQCLDILSASVKKGDADPNHVAELTDRIARDIWTKQVYGSSMAIATPHPIHNASKVNERRLKLGLPESVEVYAIYHGIEYSTPSKSIALIDSIDSYNQAQLLFLKFKDLMKDRKIDSATTNLRNAIKHYGDLSNDDLFEATTILTTSGETNLLGLTSRILKVLIWREWDGLSENIDDKRLDPIKSSAYWTEIKALLISQH